ncbi:Rrf2 family transcriptional regulator, partial [Rhizobium ruizarguesonis]
VVRVTEDSFAMSECFEDDGEVECPLVDSCGLNSALRKALNAFFAVLSEYSIDDLVKARPQINFLLGITGGRFAQANAAVATAQGFDQTRLVQRLK